MPLQPPSGKSPQGGKENKRPPPLSLSRRLKKNAQSPPQFENSVNKQDIKRPVPLSSSRTTPLIVEQENKRQRLTRNATDSTPQWKQEQDTDRDNFDLERSSRQIEPHRINSNTGLSPGLTDYGYEVESEHLYVPRNRLGLSPAAEDSSTEGQGDGSTPATYPSTGVGDQVKHPILADRTSTELKHRDNELMSTERTSTETENIGSYSTAAERLSTVTDAKCDHVRAHTKALSLDFGFENRQHSLDITSLIMSRWILSQTRFATSPDSLGLQKHQLNEKLLGMKSSIVDPCLTSSLLQDPPLPQLCPMEMANIRSTVLESSDGTFSTGSLDYTVELPFSSIEMSNPSGLNPVESSNLETSIRRVDSAGMSNDYSTHTLLEISNPLFSAAVDPFIATTESEDYSPHPFGLRIPATLSSEPLFSAAYLSAAAERIVRRAGLGINSASDLEEARRELAESERQWEEEEKERAK
jgi:hypothetical protein